MSRDEAQQCLKRINASADSIRADLLLLYEREGWKALGYPSWRKCALAEFPRWSQAYIYYMLKVARIEQGLLDTPDIEPDISNFLESLPESYLYELRQLDDPLEQRIALQLVYSTAPKVIPSGKPTIALLQEAVKTVQHIKENGGKVELDEGIMAAEAHVILGHHERVQAHVDHSRIQRANKGREPILDKAKGRIVSQFGTSYQFILEVRTTDDYNRLRKALAEGKAADLLITINEAGRP